MLGIVRAKDLLACCLAGQAIDLQAARRRPLFVPENLPALKALEMFKQTVTHLAIVIDEHGCMEGLVIHHDLMEAIVGDILSAGFPAESPAVRREDGSWLLEGMLPVDEFKQLLGLKHIPGEVRFEVVDMDRHRIDKALVKPSQ